MRKKIAHLLGRVMGGLLVLASLAVTASAQFQAGIEGTVTDTSGAVVAKVAITVTNKETGVSHKASTSDAGFYGVTNLAPGKYTVTATSAGFKTKVIADVEVRAESVQGVNLTLEPGAVTTQVTVAGEAIPLTETEDATQSATLTKVDVANLPQFRGDPYELLRLSPGVFGQGARDGGGSSVNFPNYSGVGGSDRGIFQWENAVQISSNGSRVEANGYYLDGVTTNSQGWGGATVITPNEEAVTEIKVEVSPYSAENSHGAGAVVQTVTKNGTNNFHGSAALRVHSPGLNAFQRWGGPNGASANRDNLLTHDVLGSLGGPIRKDKLFFFYSFDHLKTGGATYRANSWVETSQWISLLPPGSLAAKIFAVPGSGFTNPKLLPSTCALLGLTEGTNCATVTGGVDLGSNTGTSGTIVNTATGGGLDSSPDVAHVEYDGQNDNIRATQHNGRVDFEATEKDRITFSLFDVPLKKTFLPGGWVDGRQYDIFNTDSKSYTAALMWTRILNPTTINEARANVTRWYFDEIKSNPQSPWGVPIVNIAIPNNTVQAGNSLGPGVFYQTTYTFRDTLSKVRNSHSLKFGVEVAREQNNSANTWGARPSYDFKNLWSFANDAPIDEGTTTYDPKTGFPSDFRKYIRVSTYGLFAQDNWKARRNLTLTGGLRYDYFSPLHDKFGRLSNIVLGSGGSALTGAKMATGGNFTNPDRKNFGPVIGFAWSPGTFVGHEFHNNFVLRGGFGVVYDRIPDNVLLQAVGNPPDFVAAAISNLSEIVYGFSTCGTYCFSGFPANPATILTFDPATGLPIGGQFLAKPSITGAVQNLGTPSVTHYSVEGQYDLGHNWMASLSYQGSQGRKYPRSLNYALFFPQNGNINSVTIVQTDVNSHYNAMLARVTHRFSKGLELNANYRLSKGTDDCSGDQTCYQTYPFDQRTEMGPSDFDVRHSITAYAVWELPIVRNRHDWLHAAAGGWTLSPIFNFNSGFPWTPVVGDGCPGNTLKYVCPIRPATYKGGAGNDYSNSTFMRPGGNFPNGAASYFTVTDPFASLIPPTPGVGRNSFRGPRYTGFNMSFGKRFTFPAVRLLGENAGLEVRAEAYNLFNKINLSPFTFNSGSSSLGGFSSGTFVPNPTFGEATGALSGRVVEMYMRFNF
jgi:carboxypeptidase family protein/TonB-dependent receptor-like protein